MINEMSLYLRLLSTGWNKPHSLWIVTSSPVSSTVVATKRALNYALWTQLDSPRLACVLLRTRVVVARFV